MLDDVDVFDVDLFWCFDFVILVFMVVEVDDVKKDGDMFGGIVEVFVYGFLLGFGFYVYWDCCFDGWFVQVFMSIQVIKGVEVGDGFEIMWCCGLVVYDEFFVIVDGIICGFDCVGGIEGGMFMGIVFWVCVGMKFIVIVLYVLCMIDVVIGDDVMVYYQWLDVCVVFVVGVVVEVMVVIEFVNVVLEKFGGDSICEMCCNFDGYLDGIFVELCMMLVFEVVFIVYDE